MTRLAYTPRNDAIFKMLFGDGRDVSLLTAFLQAALDLPAEDYEEVTLVDPHLVRDGPEDKLSILDVKVRTRTGKLIDIEIQLCNHGELRERIVFYLTRMVNEQIGPGDDYWTIKRAICILIADFTLIPQNGNYRNRFTLSDLETRTEFTDLLEVDTLELPKLPQGEDGTPLWDWLKFLSANEEEELEMLAERNPQVKQAVVKFMALTEDESTRMIATSRNILRHDMAAKERYDIERGRKQGQQEGREEGLEEGRQEGRQEERLSVARNLLQLGQPLEMIAQATGLPLEQIRSLMH